jgi:hypothetical protein
MMSRVMAEQIPAEYDSIVAAELGINSNGPAEKLPVPWVSRF